MADGEAGELAARVVVGDMRAVARLLSHVENDPDNVQPALDLVYRHSGRAQVVGITGVPGAGKSTLVNRIATEIRRDGRTVGVIVIDPSSALSGGAILGDRIRISDHGADPGVFIRSMATRGGSGGVAAVTSEAIDVLDAAGFDVILVETVGVGQAEFRICDVVHTTIVVSAPGLGDVVQAIKAGLLEMADIHVVNKSDRPDASRTLGDLKAVMHMVTRRRQPDWTPPVLATSADSGAGVAELVATMQHHRESLELSGEGKRRLQAGTALRMIGAIQEAVLQRISCETQGENFAAALARVAARQTSPRVAAAALIHAHWPQGADRWT